MSRRRARTSTARSSAERTTDRTTARPTARRTKPPNKQRSRRWPWRVALVGVVAVSLYASGDWVLHRSYFTVHKVLVRGMHHESLSDVLRVSGLGLHPAMIDVNDGVVARRIDRLTWVAATLVTKQWPSTVRLVITERVPVAVARVAHGRLQLVDATDKPLAVVSVSRRFPLLELSGANASAPWRFAPFEQAAARVASDLPVAFRAQVAAISISHSGDVALHMTTPLTFVLGPASDLVAKFSAIAAVIHASAVNSVALRAGDVIDVTVPGTLTVSGP